MSHAAHRLRLALADTQGTVFTTAELIALGMTRAQIDSAIAADRFRRIGRAIVSHTGPLTAAERGAVALGNSGGRSFLSGFTAAAAGGLRGWARPTIDVLVPYGRPACRLPGVRTHHRVIQDSDVLASRRMHRMAPALIVATSTMESPRVACALLAAAAQQRLTTPAQLRSALARAQRTRHRPFLLAAVEDIAMGAQALSEIDFIRLCRRYRLPLPRLQAVRRDIDGRRRYLDAVWDLPDGRELIVEIDGAIHLSAVNWWADQHRQNELTLGRRMVLRFPATIVRTDELTVVDQIARAHGLDCPSARLAYRFCAS